MADGVLRDAERRWVTDPSPEAEVGLLRARLRGNLIPREQVELATYGMTSARAALGCDCAGLPSSSCSAFGGSAIKSCPWRMDLPLWFKSLASRMQSVPWPELEVACDDCHGMRGQWAYVDGAGAVPAPQYKCLSCKGSGKSLYTPTFQWLRACAILPAAKVAFEAWREAGDGWGVDLVANALDAVEVWTWCPCGGRCLTRVRDSQALGVNAHPFFHVVRSTGWNDGAARSSWLLALELLDPLIGARGDGIQELVVQGLLDGLPGLRNLLLPAAGKQAVNG